jgi:hypothetical protein
LKFSSTICLIIRRGRGSPPGSAIFVVVRAPPALIGGETQSSAVLSSRIPHPRPAAALEIQAASPICGRPWRRIECAGLKTARFRVNKASDA